MEGVWFGMVQYGTISYVEGVRYGTVRYRIVWHGPRNPIFSRTLEPKNNSESKEAHQTTSKLIVFPLFSARFYRERTLPFRVDKKGGTTSIAEPAKALAVQQQYQQRWRQRRQHRKRQKHVHRRQYQQLSSTNKAASVQWEQQQRQ
jgi:hypothetical protein